MNSKGHAPTLLIVLVAIVLIVGAIVTFVQANKPVGVLSKELGQGLRTQEQYEKYVKQTFEDSVSVAVSNMPVMPTSLLEPILRGKFMREVDMRDYGLPGAGNFFLVVKRGNYDVKFDGTNWIVEIDGLFVPYSSGTIEITHNFNATAIISGDGSTQYIYK